MFLKATKIYGTKDNSIEKVFWVDLSNPCLVTTEAVTEMEKGDKEYIDGWWVINPSNFDKPGYNNFVSNEFLTYIGEAPVETLKAVRPSVSIEDVEDTILIEGDIFKVGPWSFKVYRDPKDKMLKAWIYKQDIGSHPFGKNSLYSESKVKEIIDLWFSYLTDTYNDEDKRCSSDEPDAREIVCHAYEVFLDKDCQSRYFSTERKALEYAVKSYINSVDSVDAGDIVKILVDRELEDFCAIFELEVE